MKAFDNEDVRRMAESGSSLAQSLLALQRQWKVAATIFLLVTCLTLIVVILMPREYKAEMKILVRNERPSLVVSPDANGPEINRRDVDETQINSEIELMTSRGLLQSVIVELQSRLSSGRDRTDVRTSALSLEKAVTSLGKHLHVEAARKSNIIEVSFADHDPDHAATTLEILLAKYLDAHLTAHATPGSYAFFADQANTYRKQLDSLDARIAEYERLNDVLGLPQQEELLVRAREEIRSALLASEASLAATRESHDKGQQDALGMAARVATDSRSIPNQYSIERMRTVLVELTNKRADLLTFFLPSDRQVQDIEAQIVNTTQHLEVAERDTSTEQVTTVNPLKQAVELEVAHLGINLAAEKARRASLGKQIGEYQGRLAHLAAVKQSYEQLQRSRKQLENTYDLYVTKQEEARVAESLDRERFSNVAVVERPLALYKPSQPKLFLDLFLGVFLSICLAFCGVLIKDHHLDGVSDASSLRHLTGLPVFVPPSWESM